jgi:TonB family protein
MVAGTLILALLFGPGCATIRPAKQPARPSAPVATAVVPVVEIKPPPPDRWVKVKGRNLVLKSGRVVTDVTSPGHRPELPEPFNRAGSVHRGTYKVCIGTDGRVRSVSTLKTAGKPVVDQAFRSAIQGWRHQPTRLGTRRVPFCYPLGVKVTFSRRT